MFKDRGLEVGGLSFGGGRLRFNLETVDGRPSLVIRGDNRAVVVFDLGRINITPAAGDPATPSDGDIWYDDTSGLFQFRQEGVTESLSGDDAPVDATYVVSSANATLTAELVLGTDVIMAGALAARPAAGTAGRLYLVTDDDGGTLFRDTGAAWVQVSKGVTEAAGHTIRENGTDQTSRTGLNFIDADAGAGLITDDAGGDETEVNLSLYRLEAADHSHQSTGLQAGQLDHGLALTGLTDDDHTQYLLVSGTRAMTGDLDMGGNDIYNVRNMYPDPGGRLTLTSATPVLVADAANQTTIYYALYAHDLVPLYDGTNWDVFRFTELSIAMAASANWAANSNFDCFVYNDGGTLRLVTGPAWTSDTGRGAGAGTTELVRLNGRWTNAVSMTGRYAAASTVTVGISQGLYVGTIRTTGSAGTTTWEIGGIAANGDPALLYLWNMYNRVSIAVNSRDSTNSWTYQTDTWRSANASNTCRVTFVRGLNEDGIWALHGSISNPTSSSSGQGGVGLDTTSGNSGLASSTYRDASSVIVGSTGLYAAVPGLGLHFVQAVEKCDTVVAALTFYGTGAVDSGLENAQSGLTYMGLH